MYETSGNHPQGETLGKCKEPDWEAEIETERNSLAVIIDFKTALFKFIGVIGTHSFRRKDNSSIPELLGTVEIDIAQRETKIDKMMDRLASK